jgi:carbon monoxide dehydrogenase subunit G
MTQNRLTLSAHILPALLLPSLLLLAVAAPALAQAPSPATPPALTGKWKVHMTVAGNEQTQQCSFTQTDKAIAGTCVSDQGEVKVAGSVDGNKATWKFDSEYNGTPITLVYTGAFDDKGKLTGSVEVQPFSVTGDFDVSPADAAAAAGPVTSAAPAAASMPATTATVTAPTSLTGKWHNHTTVNGTDYDSDCVIAQTGKAIAGTCKSDQGEVKITGTYDGNKVTYKFDSEYQGTPINLTYTGAFDDKGKVVGIVDVQPFAVTGDFEMKPAQN